MPKFQVRTRRAHGPDSKIKEARLGYERKEYYVVTNKGFKILIGVSRGFEGGFTFNSDAFPNADLSFRAFVNQIFGRIKNGSKIIDSDGNTMELNDLLDFAAHSRGRPFAAGFIDETSKTVDAAGFMFARYKPRLMFS